MKKHIDNKHKVIIAKYILHVKTKLSMMVVILDLKKVFETQNNYVSYHNWFFFNLTTTQEFISNIDVIHWKPIIIPYKGIWSFVHNGMSLPMVFCLVTTLIKFVSLLKNNLSKNTILLWRAPKFLVKPKLGLSYSTAKLWGTQGMFPAFNTRQGKGACWSSRMGLRRVISYSLTWTCIKPTNKLISSLSGAPLVLG